MQEIMYKKPYEEYRAELNKELGQAAESFVRIGYLLKVARDTDILQESKYSNYTEFAQGEFGLDKSQVSRFIQINDRFSEGGNSESLLPQYKGFGSAKLTLMLALPDELNEELSPDFSKAEIQEIKREVEEEKKITPIEVMVEPAKEETKNMSLLAKVLYQIGEVEPDVMADMVDESYLTPQPNDTKLMEILAPAGQKMYMVRIPGTGKFALNIVGQTGSLLNIRENAKEPVTPADIGEAILEVCTQLDKNPSDEPATGKEICKDLYEAKNEEVAPVQPKKESHIVTEKPKKEKPKEEKPVSRETLDVSVQNPEKDKYGYMELEKTIATMESLLANYERARDNTGDPIRTTAGDLLDEAYAKAIYNAIEELKFLKKMGGSRR